MIREDIYDHLAQVYLGKKQKNEPGPKNNFSAWLFINFLVTAIIFASSIYGLTAFLTHNNDIFEENIIYSLHKGPIRMAYNFKDPLVPSQSFSIKTEGVDSSRYGSMHFSIRAKEEGSPGILKVEWSNKRNETASYYIQGINQSWQEFDIPLRDFQQISDWESADHIAFVLESWNVENSKGLILIDEIFLASDNENMKIKN